MLIRLSPSCGSSSSFCQNTLISARGCGPIGLITAAVAHAYSARKIIAFDSNPARVAFARKYISPTTGRPVIDHVFLNEALPSSSRKSKPKTNGLAGKLGEEPTSAGIGDGEAGPVEDEEEETVGDRRWEWAKIIAARYLEEAGLSAEQGVDRVIEASGAEDCGLLGVAIAKQGGICKLSLTRFLQTDPWSDLAVGLSHIQTNIFPTLAVTNKELDVRGKPFPPCFGLYDGVISGLTRYTASCFPSAIDLLSRGVVDLQQLITKTFPLTQSRDAFEAVRSGEQIKVIIKNQE